MGNKIVVGCYVFDGIYNKTKSKVITLLRESTDSQKDVFEIQNKDGSKHIRFREELVFVEKQDLKIYLLERQDEVGWDEYAGHVIAAENEEEVIEIAQTKERGNHTDADWSKAKISLLGEYSGDSMQSHIILSDFNAG